MKVYVQIEGVEFRMEVETGAAASILYYTDYERYFKYLAVRPSGNIIPFLCWCTFQDRLYAPNNGCNAYLCSLFSCHISSAFYVSIYFSRLSRLYKVSYLEETTLRVHESIFFRLKRKLFVLRLVCLWTKHKYLCFSLPFKLT